MKAAFAYFGGKTKMAPSIVDLMPEHRVYIEPFFGSGAVLMAKPPVDFEIVNDLDNAVVAFWRCLRDRLDELEWACAMSPHARVEFTAAQMDDALEDLELARRFWVRVNQSFAKTAGRKTGWSITTARTQSIPQSCMSRLGRFTDIAERLSNVTIEICDAADLVDRLATADTVVYADPPYLASTRVLRHGSGGDYRFDMGLPEAHERLAEALLATPAKVILSGYPSALYERLYAGWWSTDRVMTVHSSNSRTRKRLTRTERIWCNFEPGLSGEAQFDFEDADQRGR